MCLRYKLKTKLKEIVRADPRSKKYFLKEHFKREKNDEVICDHVVVNLKCPISARKMEIPIRTRNCEHVQSFGLETLVRVASTETIFNLTSNHCSAIQCPVCKKSGLIVQDNFTKKLLDESPSTLVYLDIKGDITYGPEVKDEPIEVITIEDDEEEGKENMIKENHQGERKTMKRKHNDYHQTKRIKSHHWNPFTSGSNKQRSYEKRHNSDSRGYSYSYRRQCHRAQDYWDQY